MESIKTEPVETGDDTEEAGDPLDLRTESDYNLDTAVKVELVVEEEGDSYLPSQEYPGVQGGVGKREFEELMKNETVSFHNDDNSDSDDSAPKRKRRKAYDSDEDYVDRTTKKERKRVKRKKKKMKKMGLPVKYPSEIEDKVEIINLTEVEREAEFNNTLRELRIKAKHHCELCALKFASEKLLEMHNRIHSKKSGDIECDICHCYLKSNQRLRHIRNHYARYQCKECGLQFPNKDRALVHVTQTHVPRTFDCPFESCGKSYKRPKDLQWHIAHHPAWRHPCTICSSVFKSIAMLNRHIRKSHSTQEPVMYECPHCNQAFLTAGDLMTHRTTDHPTDILASDIRLELIMPCPECELTFLTRRELAEHRNNQHAAPGTKLEFLCELCDKSFSSQNFLNGHIKRMHCHRVKRFECDHCHRLYYTKPELRAHILWSHERGRGGLACACGRVFRALGRLRQHALRAHGGEREREKSYQCGVCGNRFETSYLLKRHTARHLNTATYPCPECGLRFKDRPYVQVHYKLKHLNMTRAEINAGKTKRQPMTIDKCSELNRMISIEDVKALTGVEELVITNELEKNGEKGFPCDQCGKVFKTNALLRRHNKSHSDITYPCSGCDMRFKDKRYVQVHYQLRHLNMTRADLRRAKGEGDREVVKKHKCDECGKSFATKSLLRRHSKIHAVQKIEEPTLYPCSECDTLFKNKSYVKIHYKIKHLNMTWDEAKRSNRLEEEQERAGEKKQVGEGKEVTVKIEKETENGSGDDVSEKNDSGIMKEDGGSEMKDDASEMKEDEESEDDYDDDDESVSVDTDSDGNDNENGDKEKENPEPESEEEVYIPTPEVNTEEVNDEIDANEVASKDSIDATNGKEIVNGSSGSKVEKIFQVPTFDTFAELISDS